MSLTKTEKKVENMIDLIVQVRDAFGTFHLENMSNYLKKHFVDIETHNQALMVNAKQSEELRLLSAQNLALKSQMKKLMGQTEK